MAKGDRLEPAELLIRRFNPQDTRHTKQDEGTGRVRLSSDNFQWHEGHTQLSVYRDSVLAAKNLPRAAALDDQSWGLYGVTVEEVHAITRPGPRAEDPPQEVFEAKEDPWPPVEPPALVKPRDEAHAVIVKAKNLNKRRVSELAGKFRVLSFER